LKEGLVSAENAKDSLRRWSPFQAFIFVLLAALGCWGFVGVLVYLLMD
jgi:CHASE1-domain containing sensor protein